MFEAGLETKAYLEEFSQQNVCGQNQISRYGRKSEKIIQEVERKRKEK